MVFRLTPYRGRRGAHSMLPEVFSDFFDFNWPEQARQGWQSFNVDVKETADGYEFQAELPGVAKDNININLDNGYLTIGVRQDNITQEDNSNYIRRERRQMASQRSFYVGNINSQDVQAKYDNGILEIKLPKPTDAGPNQRNIPIQ